MLEVLGIKIEEEGKTSLRDQLRLRKEELEQLQIMLTEAQLNKNPLTITKLLPSLPRTNPLVKQYLALKKEQASFINKYTTYLARISERIELFRTDAKKPRKDQIRENCDKPHPNEIKEFIETIRQSAVDLSKEAKELTRILTNTFDVASKVHKYCEEKQDLSAITSL